jgi:hypothetical protein
MELSVKHFTDSTRRSPGRRSAHKIATNFKPYDFFKGNTAILKPSEIAANTAQAVDEIFSKAFDKVILLP